MKKRIIGIDVARALAVIGMIIVNFKIVFGNEGADWLKSVASIFDGKAAATFVVLAGVGIGLMAKSALVNNDKAKLQNTKKRIAKRALFLFLVGLSYIVIWPADILHFYGIYMLVILLMLKASQRTILWATFLMIFSYPFLMLLLNYETGWNFNTLTYLDFWSVKGFVRNLFYNGFHPVIPWTAYMLFGYWFGQQNLNDDRFLKKALKVSALAFIILQICSQAAIHLLSEGSATAREELTIILGSSPMPPLPVYMLMGISVAIAVITVCILVAKRFESNPLTRALHKTGQLALTFYVAHVIIGMGMVEIITDKALGTYSLEFSVGYALFFSLCCILFAVVWTRFNKMGPLEWLMRRVVG